MPKRVASGVRLLPRRHGAAAARLGVLCYGGRDSPGSHPRGDGASDWVMGSSTGAQPLMELDERANLFKFLIRDRDAARAQPAHAKGSGTAHS